MADEQQPGDEQQGITVASEIAIPGGAFAESSLLIVSYIDTDGNHKYAWRNTGEGSVATMVGLMELIKLNILVEAMG